MKLTIKTALLASLMIGLFTSCKKILELNPGTELTAGQMYRDVYDANAAVMGIYGKFMALADRYIILNELRGDLMDFTHNADEYLRQLSHHNVTPDNPYINPRPFYELILNCNDALHHFRQMRATNKLSEDDFNQRYSDLGCLRSFLYLQLGIHYGELPYVTEALENINDVADPSRFPRLPLQVLVDSLISFTEPLPHKELYTTNISGSTGTALNITLDGYQTEKFFINKKVLLGDLYLWKGDYRKAALYYKAMMDFSTSSTNLDNRYLQYKIGWGGGDESTEVIYSKYGDASSLSYTSGWGTIFEASDDRFSWEILWALPYDNKFKPENPLIKLFSPIGGNYLVKPSQVIIDSWNQQLQNPMGVPGATNGVPYDARGLLSVRTIGGQPTITKFISNYISQSASVPLNPLVKNGRWFLFRTAHLHLRFAEAANRDGYPRLGYALFNNGIPAVYAPPAGVTDVTNYQNTLDLDEPYKFDARMGEIPNYRSPWYRNIGIRRRALLQPITLTATNFTDSIYQVEEGLINEQALETAFEGTRWPDLLRVAIRRNQPAFIADRIYNKLMKSGMSVGEAARARHKLMQKDWFLPFKF
ncbi:RagB/SusD family nutrient uptake outer membrane protein [Longitalea arenae]|uniref:RagB/SusD family nutrient uptake outer membrane protein n=1 Tax=Longitalea arenae TaxID=2812558 RepID=UPI0019689FB4|nr:RagB/SusD family nutrient uptake outer membrane protein [Longitalea arenae]